MKCYFEPMCPLGILKVAVLAKLKLHLQEFSQAGAISPNGRWEGISAVVLFAVLFFFKP